MTATTTGGGLWRSADRPPTPSTGRLGAGLVDVPAVEAIDPAAAIMDRPEVPEQSRFCSRCGSTVGRARHGRPARVSGYCGMCRHPYSFVPRLQPGELVAGQYRVVGCLAYGGLGWIHLARDEHVSRRWVVLKGMLDMQDPDAMAAALAERQFLARVEHPNVVRIYNFVQHAGAGYIVMEYVGGRTLKAVLQEGAGSGPDPAGALPVELGIAYVLGILPAFGYLHGLGLVYNDLKVENVMLHGQDVKLIDLGAVTRLDDPNAVVYGTDGYHAPEVAVRGPSVASDLYSVARCLAVLVTDLHSGGPASSDELPSPDVEPRLARHDSLHRFLQKGTAELPEERFQSAGEMAEQLFGVLREVVAVEHGTWTPAASRRFGGDLHAIHVAGGAAAMRPDWRHLPAPNPDPGDPSASFVTSLLGVGDPAVRASIVEEAIEQGRIPATPEALLSLARALVETRAFAEAEFCLRRAQDASGPSWRDRWHLGQLLLAQGRPAEARMELDAVYAELPGELAPKLAIALAAELEGDLPAAARLYEVVVATDPGFTSAAFGLARVREAQSDRRGAVEAYELVAPESRLHVDAQVALARTLLGGGRGGPDVEDLVRASALVERLMLDDGRRTELEVELLEAALRVLASGAAADAGVAVLGRPLEELSIRLALERAYRDMARPASRPVRIRLVDRANRVRPATRR